jgi:large subunit ribosomal protein L23
VSPLKTRDPRDILLAPIASEKSYNLIDDGKYSFMVSPSANKTEIKIAIEQIFGVNVISVNTQNREGKRRRTRFGWGKKPDRKRAIVTLAPGQKIDIFAAPAS